MLATHTLNFKHVDDDSSFTRRNKTSSKRKRFVSKVNLPFVGRREESNTVMNANISKECSGALFLKVMFLMLD